ncbi:hypothetical protein, partial [Pseudonocardia halophobica]|uniref:hypothetical protein n=1 Tax=Pseudonocardia halophobica TaxID=29401 RepID=UPI0022F2EC71
QAHDRDLVIRVSGRPERDGTLTWLYEASIVSTIGPVDELRSELVAQGRTQADQLAFPELPESNK